MPISGYCRVPKAGVSGKNRDSPPPPPAGGGKPYLFPYLFTMTAAVETGYLKEPLPGQV